jgi:hypothetical protein
VMIFPSAENEAPSLNNPMTVILRWAISAMTSVP